MFTAIENALYPVVCDLNAYLSNYVLVFLLIAVGLWYSIRTRFVQVRCFGEGMRRVFGNLTLRGEKHASGMSSFQALATAIAAQVGTGNIVGASGAILTGGPGAIFWMWVIAFFGMATIYAEATLALTTRQVDKDGTIHGGPVYYITTAFKGGFGKFLAGFFAVAIILALGFMGCMVQSNSIGSTFETAFGVPAWIVGIALVVLCGVIFLGGVRRLAAVAEKIVPVMAAIFLAGALVVLVVRIQYIPATFGMIFKYAFQPQAILGGGFGYALKTALSQGAKRGLFSNESGLGSAPIVAAAAATKNPARQALVAMTGTFWSTVVICAITGIVLVSTLLAHPGIIEGGSIKEGAALASAAFATIPYVGTPILVLGMISFAYSTILGWSYYGNRCATYLFGRRAVRPYQIIYVLVAFLGAIGVGDVVWTISDIGNALMAVPNIIMVLLLSGMIARETKYYVYDGHLDETYDEEIPVIESK